MEIIFTFKISHRKLNMKIFKSRIIFFFFFVFGKKLMNFKQNIYDLMTEIIQLFPTFSIFWHEYFFNRDAKWVRKNDKVKEIGRENAISHFQICQINAWHVLDAQTNIHIHTEMTYHNDENSENKIYGWEKSTFVLKRIWRILR